MHMLALLAGLLAAGSWAPATAQAQICTESLRNYTETVDELGIFSGFLEVYEGVGIGPPPRRGIAVFAPSDRAWLALEQTITSAPSGSSSSVDSSSSSNSTNSGTSRRSDTLSDQEVDVLLAIGLYHIAQFAMTPDELLDAGNVQSALGDLSGYNVSLYFGEGSGPGGVQIEGIPDGNLAQLPATPQLICNTTLYIIDEVMLPATNINDIPTLTEIVNNLGGGGGGGGGGGFDLPLAPEGSPGISITATGPGSSISGSDNVTISDINGRTVMLAPAPEPQLAPQPAADQHAARHAACGGSLLLGLAAAAVAGFLQMAA